jgi:hypothetical protein
MKKLYFAVLLSLLCFVGSYAQKTVALKKQEGSWTEFVSKRAGFKIRFPEKPSYSKENANSEDSKGTVYWFNVSTNLGYFAVFYSEPILPERDKEDLNADYDFLKNKTAKVKNAEIVNETEIYKGQNLGREIVLKIKKIIVINRYFLVDKKLYLIIVSLDLVDFENEVKRKEVNKFLDSFTLLNKK